MLNRCNETRPSKTILRLLFTQTPDYESLLLLIIKLRNYKPAAAQPDLTLHITAPTLITSLKTITLCAFQHTPCHNITQAFLNLVCFYFLQIKI